jgi:hypothetical protein
VPSNCAGLNLPLLPADPADAAEASQVQFERNGPGRLSQREEERQIKRIQLRAGYAWLTHSLSCSLSDDICSAWLPSHR